VIPSFEIHGGVKGLFDLGPPACGLKANIIDIWRKHFVLEENMLEVGCALTPRSLAPFRHATEWSLADGMHELDPTSSPQDKRAR
jgi:hypothetical protein